MFSPGYKTALGGGVKNITPKISTAKLAPLQLMLIAVPQMSGWVAMLHRVSANAG